jgi:hypothetical protein
MRSVMAMTPSQVFEDRMSRNDSVNVLGKHLLYNVTSTTAPSIAFTLEPSGNQLGTRASSFSALYTRYRFKYIRFRFLVDPSTTSVANQFTVFGVLDDGYVGTGTAPTTVDDVMNLRCSAIALGNQTVPTEFVWRPRDATKWYYTTPETSIGDLRLAYSGVVYSATSIVTTFNIEIDYSIVFAGAMDTT